MRIYKTAPWDIAVRIVTAYVFALMVFFIAWGITQPAGRVLLAVGVFMFIVIWICWEIAPKRYEVTEDVVVIVRCWPFRKISIPIAEIREVRRVKLSSLGTVRTLGVGGLFGYSGRFWARDLGKFYAGVTNTGRTVLIAATNDGYVISPEDPDEFVNDMESAFPTMKRV